MKRSRIAMIVTALFHGASLHLANRQGLLAGALPVVVDKLDDVPEAARGAYVEKDGKFHLDIIVEDTAGLKSALQKEREAAAEARRAASALAKKYEGIDPDAVREMLKRFGDEEEQSLIKQGKFEEVLQKRTEKMQQAHQRELDEVRKETKAEQARREKYEQRVLDSHLMAAATKAGVHQHAIEDVMFRGRALFRLDEEGNPVQLGDDGKTVVVGKNGKDPFSPMEWIEGTMKEKAPHWFPSQGSGGGTGGDGSRGSQGGQKTIKRADFDAITDPARKSETAKTHSIVD